VAVRNGKPETGTETKVSSVESDVAGDPRASALAALVYGASTPDAPITPDAELVVDESEVLDFGGRSKAVVIISYYNQFVDGVVKSARKGQVITTDADSLKRGVRIKALRKLEG
jgi:hypothetical protein